MPFPRPLAQANPKSKKTGKGSTHKKKKKGGKANAGPKSKKTQGSQSESDADTLDDESEEAISSDESSDSV